MNLMEVAGRNIARPAWYDTRLKDADAHKVADMVALMAADSREAANALFAGRLRENVTPMAVHNLTNRQVFNTDTGKLTDEGWFTQLHPNATLGTLFEYFQGITASGKRKASINGFEKYLDTIA